MEAVGESARAALERVAKTRRGSRSPPRNTRPVLLDLLDSLAATAWMFADDVLRVMHGLKENSIADPDLVCLAKAALGRPS